MTDTQTAVSTQPAAVRFPFFRTVLVLWVLGFIGVVLITPFALTLQPDAVAKAAARLHIEPYQVMAISFAQNAIILALAVLVGLWAARKIGLGAPLIAAFLTKGPAPKYTPWTLVLAVVVGLATGLAIIALDHWVFVSDPSVRALMNSAGSAPHHAALWKQFLSCFYGGIDEEIFLRLAVLSLLALFFRTLARWGGADRTKTLTSGVFWTANLVAAVVFGLGHLPATAALAHLTPMLVARAVVLNGFGGVVFGVLYRRFGLEWAMTAHFSADLVLHVLPAAI